MNKPDKKTNELFDEEKEKIEYEQYLHSQKYLKYKNKLISIKNKELNKYIQNKSIK